MSNYDHIVDSLAPQIGVMLETLLTEGNFQLPIHTVAIGSNGSIMAASYHDIDENGSLKCSILCRSIHGGGLRLPINMFFIDSATGNAARAVIDEGGEQSTLGLLQ